MNRQYEQVKEFHLSMSQPVADTPTILEGAGDPAAYGWGLHLSSLAQTMRMSYGSGIGGRVLLRSALMLEELAELLAANTLVDQVDALTDIQYLVMGSFVEVGVDPDGPFDAVQRANMSKLDENGKPIIDETGKVRKPEGWKGPEFAIALNIEQQRAEAYRMD